MNKLAVIFGNNSGTVYDLLPNNTMNLGVALNYHKTKIPKATGVEYWMDRYFVMGHNGSYTNF